MRITNRYEPARIFTNAIAALLVVVTIETKPCDAASPTSQESIQTFRANLAMDYGNPDAHLILAKGKIAAGDSLTAFLICEDARTLFGEDAFHASFNVVFRGDVTDVLFHARKQVLLAAIRLSPKSIPPLKEIADLYAAHGEPNDAASVLRRALQIDPNNFALVQLLALNLNAAGKSADAKSMLNDWCRDHPDTAPAWEQRVTEQQSQNSDAAGALLDEAITKFPTDGQLLLMRATLEEDQKPDEAQADLVDAAGLASDSAAAQAAAGRFFLKIHHDPERSLNYYLAAYFLDPDFNDWESVDDRVRESAEEIAQAKLTAVKDAGAGAEDLVVDSNPFVQTAAISQLSADVSDHLRDELLTQSISDCPPVREAAIHLLCAHPSQATNGKIDAIIKSEDPWDRAAGVRLLAGSRQTPALDELSGALGDPSVLVRFNAAIALLEAGTAGQPIVVKAMQKETNPWLHDWMAGRLRDQKR